MTDWHGWSRRDHPHGSAIHVGPLPGRKGIALYSSDPRVSYPYAYFRDVESAERFMREMDFLTGVTQPNEPGCVKCGKPHHAIDILGEAWCFSCYWQEMADPPGSEVVG